MIYPATPASLVMTISSCPIIMLNQRKYAHKHNLIKGEQIKTLTFQISYIIVCLISPVPFRLQKSFCMQNKDTMR